VNGQTRVRRGLSRAVTANCLGNLKTLMLPAVVSCYGSYTEARRTRAKEWSRNESILVTIDSLVDNRAVGTFVTQAAQQAAGGIIGEEINKAFDKILKPR